MAGATISVAAAGGNAQGNGQSGAANAAGTGSTLSVWLNQLKLLMKKNYLIKRRAGWATCVEIFLPVLIVLLLVMMKSLFSVTNEPDVQYTDPSNVAEGNTIDYNKFEFSGNVRVPRIVFIPDNAFMRNLSLSVNASIAASGERAIVVYPPFASEDELETYIGDADYGRENVPALAMAVVFKRFGRANGVPESDIDATAPNQWEYLVRVNRTAVKNAGDNTNPYSVQYASGYTAFQTSMFSFMQTFVDSFIANAGTVSDSGIQYREIALPMPIPAHKTDRFATIFSSVIPMFYILSYLYPSARIVRNLVEEKELRIKEGLRMMGLSDSAAWTAVYLTSVVTFGITALFNTIIGSTTIFQYSNKGIIFVYFWLFGVAMTSYAAVISTIFSRSKTASTAAYLLIFGAYIPTFVLGSNGGTPSSYSESALTWASILPPTAMGLGATQIAFLEGYQLGITNDTVSLLVFNYRFGDAIGMLVLSIFLYGFMSWYMDKVIPSEFGNALDPLFCFSRAYWMPAADPNDSLLADRSREPAQMQNSMPDRNQSLGETFEPVAADVKKAGAGVQINGLRKEYADGNVAVKDLTLNMYENQIFCLLGHNGAGKSTTISMLTGLTSITGGDAIIDGLSVRHEMNAVRSRIGVCPQHDVLFPNLTVREHLELYSSMKGMPKEEVDAAVTAAIQNVGLTEKEHSFSSSLSGGQKRKLSVAIAFTGGSKIVFLDEPTSGMDPYSRRATWDTLNRFKAGRVIVLTTHFMDEADILGDRIAIMNHGVVQCCGSPLFLKSLYGVGYTLTFTREIHDPTALAGAVSAVAGSASKAFPPLPGSAVDHKSSDVKSNGSKGGDALNALVMSRIPKSEVLSSIGAELSFRMPLDASSEFPDLFREVDSKRHHYEVVNYGVSVTTLEEVFLKVGGAHKNNKADGSAPTPKAAAAAAGASTPHAADTGLSGSTAAEAEELDMALRVEQEMNRTDAEVCMRHFKALFMKRVHYAKRDKKAGVFNLVIPVVFLIFGFAILQIPTSIVVSPYYFDSESYNSPNYVPVNTAFPTLNAQLNAFLLDAAPSLSTNCALEPMSGVSSLAQFSDRLLTTRDEFEQSKYFAYYAAPAAEAIAWVNNSALDRSSFRVTDPVEFVNGTAAFAGSRMKQFLFYFTNVTGYQSLPIMANVMHNSLFRASSGDARATIVTGIHPFPLTQREQVLVTAGNGFAIALITVIAFMFIPAAYAVFVVRERETKIKHIQSISGVSSVAYWLSTYAWDIVNYSLPFIISVIVVAAFNDPNFVGENFGAVVLAFLLYGFSVAPFTYLMSFLFSSHSTAQTVLLLVYFITGLLFLIVSFAMSLIESTQSAGKALKFIFRLFPPFCLGDTMVGLATRSLSAQLLGTTGPVGPFDMDVSGFNLLFMALESVVYLAFTFLIERYSNDPEFFSCSRSSASVADSQAAANAILSIRDNHGINDGASPDDDVDVTAEAAKIDSGAYANAAIRINHLRKVYPGDPPKVAVRNLSYVVEAGQCFGFLGINGAGKTTTLSMLSGEFQSTSGDAYLMNHSIRTEQDKCRRLIGYCPQFDALLDLLTAREHLEMFARIKGVQESKIAGMVSTMIKQLTLTEYADRPSGSYSGGNKRKLCVGIALIGNPPIVFLDEPSTGMDPVSRRFMWNFISHTMKGRSVILTTHSMEECEALCHRLGIMVGGRLKCIGSTQHIKDRFGAGYQLDVNITDEKNGVEATKVFVRDTFPGAQLVEFHGTRFKYVLPNMSTPLATVFELIEQNKQRLTIREYSVGQTTLEQIFIEFAKSQNEEKGAIAGMVTTITPPAATAAAAAVGDSSPLAAVVSHSADYGSRSVRPTDIPLSITGQRS